MPRVRVGIAPRSQPFDESMDSLAFAVYTAQQAGFEVCIEKVRRGAPGFQNAGPIISHFLKAGETHLFIAADDMLYPPDTIVRLVNADKDIISGIYRKNIMDRIEPANCVKDADTFMRQYREGGVYETDFAAGHTMTIKREVIEKMVLDYPELQYDEPGIGNVSYGLFIPMIQNRQCFQDDWSFSIRAKKSGFRIWTDFGCRLKHFCSEFLGFEELQS